MIEKQWEFVNRERTPFESLDWKIAAVNAHLPLAPEHVVVGDYYLSVTGVGNWGLYSYNNGERRAWLCGSANLGRAENRAAAKLAAYSALMQYISK